MPNRWPISSGNWSNAAIWSGSLIPTASDDVFTNNRIVYIDTDVTIRSIRNTATGSAVSSSVVGNCFYLNNGITLTTTSTGVLGGAGSSTWIPTIIVSGSASARIIGNITVNPGSTNCAIILYDSASLTITGSIDGGLFGGGLFGPYGTIARTIWMNSAGSLNISGSVSAGGNTAPSTFNGGAIVVQQPAIVNIVGNIIGAIGIGGSAIHNESIGIITITGSVAGSNVRSFSTLSNNSFGTIIVTGSCQAGSVSSAIGSLTNGTIIVYGTISSSIAAVGVQSTGTAATNLFTGPFYNTGSFNAVYAYRMQMLEPTSTTWRFDTETGGSKILYTSNQLPGVPRQTDVRHGVQYNFGLTGSLEMPDPSVVKAGVAVDNTTGSAIFAAQDVFNVLTQDINVTGSIGSTLKNASSVQTTAATISAFKV